MTEWLLFLHVLSAFALISAIVVWSAVALGATADGRTLKVADRIWDAGGGGTLVFGVWLALKIDGYDLLDGWIIAALVLWVAAAAMAPQVRKAQESGDRPRFVRMHWIHAGITLLLLADMIWKPGA